MEVFDAIRHRRAVRDYLAEPVSRPVLEQVIAAAAWAPSAMNTQPWHFTVVNGAERLAWISAKAKSFNLESADALPPGHFRDLMGDPDFNIFYDAPALLVISAPAHLRWAVEDCTLAAGTAMLMAFNLGLGSCWIGFAEAWLNSPQGLASLSLPADQRVVASLILGYPKTPAPAVARKPIKTNWIGDPAAAGGEEGSTLSASPSSRDIWNCWEPFMAYPKNNPPPCP